MSQKAENYWEAMSKKPFYTEKEVNSLLEERDKRFESERNELLGRIAESERNAASNLADLSTISNIYANIDQRIEAGTRTAPRYWNTAVDIFDYVMAQVGILENANPIFHPPRNYMGWLPWVIFGGFGAILLSGLLFTPTGGEVGKALQIPANQIAAILAIVAIGIVLYLLRRSSNKKAAQS